MPKQPIIRLADAFRGRFEPSDGRGGTEQRVLVVDDHWANIQRAASLLGGAGYTITPALNGPRALDCAAAEPPDIVLLDVVMPGMDGLEVCRRLRQTVAGREIPIILLSPPDRGDMAARALAAGGTDCVTKPCHPEELLGRVRAHLSLKATRDDLRRMADEREELIGILAHDLKNVLGGINLSAELARGRLARAGDAALPALAGGIAKASARLLAFVNKLLTAAGHRAGTPEHPSRPEGGAKILVAGVPLIGSALDKLDCEVIPATNHREVFRQIRDRVPELVLLDAALPGAFEFCRHLRALPSGYDVPLIFLARPGVQDFAVRAFAAGAVDYVRGPVHPAELRLRVETQLALKLSRDRLARLAEKRNHLFGVLAGGFEARLERMRDNARALRSVAAEFGDLRVIQLADNLSLSNSHLLGFVARMRDQALNGRKLALHPAPMSLRRAIVRTIRRFIEPARAKQVDVCFDPIPSLEDDVVLADEQAVNRVLDNLLSNAVKYSPPRTTIRLTTFSADREVQCRIMDQGPGFTNEDKARMFRRFGRLSSRPTGGESSTGLGLSIVHRLVRAMHGDITCQSSPGCGASFTVGLPRPEMNPS